MQEIVMEEEKLHEFVEEISDQVPGLKQTMEDHRKAYGAIIPYVVMDEFSNFVIEELRNHQESELFRQFIIALEHRINSDDDVATMIRTSFCETVDSHHQDKELYNRIIANLPLSIKKWLTAYK